MSFFERKNKYIELLKNSGGISNTSNIANTLFYSRSTVRRDLLLLEEDGIIQRQHGSIKLIMDSSLENSAIMRKMINKDKKITIAKLAKDFIEDNMVIFLDSSSTVNTLTPLLHHFNNLTIITNGLNIAQNLANFSNVKCFICPGTLKNKSMSIIGEYTSKFLDDFRADLAFISSKSIGPDGIYEGDDRQALCKRKMISNANRIILLIDTSKENSSGYFKLCSFSDINVIISEQKFSDGLVHAIQNSNCKFIYKQ